MKLSKGTIVCVNNLINTIIKGEKEINSVKKEIKNDKVIDNFFEEIINFSLENNNESFETKDIICVDYFNKDMLHKYLIEKLNIKISDNEANILFLRFDKLRRGEVKILEFSDEMKYINI